MWPAPGTSSRTLVVAVAPQGKLADTSTWRYHTEAGWSRSPSHLAAPLGRGTSFGVGSVYQLPGGDYVVLGSAPADGIVAWYASDPWLSGARSARLFSAPGSRGVPGFLSYQAHIDPAYSHGTSVVIGFSVNSFAHDPGCVNYAPYYDVAAYQPEFYSVALPASAGAARAAGGPRPLPPPQLRQFRRSSLPAGRGAAAVAPRPSPPGAAPVHGARSRRPFAAPVRGASRGQPLALRVGTCYSPLYVTEQLLRLSYSPVRTPPGGGAP